MPFKPKPYPYEKVKTLELVKTLPQRFLQCRLHQELTQEELGKLCGCTKSRIQKIETGYSSNPRNLIELSKVFGVNKAWLHYGYPFASMIVNLEKVRVKR